MAVTDATIAPRTPSRRADLIALLTLALAATVLFIDVLAGAGGFYIRDLARYYYPTKQILREIVLGGELPYWNPYFSAGQPMAANPEHAVFYPLTWLVLLPSYDLGFRLHILVHVYVGLLAMYALLRSMELRPFAAWFGAVSWGLGGLFLSTINLLPILLCASWLPLTCLFARRFLLRRNARDFALASLFLGVQFLAGEPTTIIQTAILLGMYALYRGWYSAPRLRRTIANVSWIAAIGAAGFGVGAAQLLPALDHVRDSARAHPFPFDLVAKWSMPWQRLGELVYPHLFGHVLQGYWGARFYAPMGIPFLLSIYAGLLVIALTLAGAFVRPRGGRFVLLLCALSTLLALGAHTPLLRWLYDAGIATSIRFPEKFAMIGVFAITIFAAQMMDRLMSGEARLRAAALAVLGTTTAFALLATLAGFMPDRLDALVATLRGAVAMALVYFAARRNERLWIAATATFVIADLALTLREINPRMPREFFDPPPIAAAFPREREAFRVFHQADWYVPPQALPFLDPGPALPWIMRNGLFPMTPAASRIRTVLERDYDRTLLLPTIELTEAMTEVKEAHRPQWYEPFMAMSNAWYLSVYRDYQGEVRRTRGDVTAVQPVGFAARPHYPRYYFADEIVQMRGRSDFVQKLVKGRFSPRMAFIEGSAFAPAAGVVRAVAETANTATLDVESSGAGFLVMSVTRHKYWDVRIDGRRVPAVAVNLAYQGVAVPAGRHRVTMVYANPLVKIGLGVSGIAVLLLAALAAYNARP